MYPVISALQHLRRNQLFIKADKCEFHIMSVSCLGSIFEKEQVWTDLEKVKAVADWPFSVDHRQFQSFLRFANFYKRFIKDYSRTVTHLTQLTSPFRTLNRATKVNSAFDYLKQFAHPVSVHHTKITY